MTGSVVIKKFLNELEVAQVCESSGCGSRYAMHSTACLVRPPVSLSPLFTEGFAFSFVTTPLCTLSDGFSCNVQYYSYSDFGEIL